jgi:hypothetical protein
MNDDLFPDAIKLSPRLQWLRDHDVMLQQQEGIWLAILDDDNVGRGRTAHDAIDNLCEKTGLPTPLVEENERRKIFVK